MADIQISVTPALWLRGFLNAVMPLEMASTPVRAVVPLEKAWRRRKRDTAVSSPCTSSGWRVGNGAEGSRQGAHKTAADGESHGADEEVGRHGEDEARFLDSAEIHVHHEEDEADTESDAVIEERWKRGGDLGHARGYGHGHGQDVVRKEGGPGDLRRDLAEVVARDDVGAATTRVGVDGLFVGDRDDDQQHDDRHRDRHDEVQCGRARQREDDEDFLGGVGRGREGVRCEYGEADGLADGLVRSIGGGKRADRRARCASSSGEGDGGLGETLAVAAGGQETWRVQSRGPRIPVLGPGV